MKLALRSDAGGVHAAQFVLEVPDLVAEPGRDFELQLGGGRVHLLGELGDQPDELAAGGAAPGAGLGCPAAWAAPRGPGETGPGTGALPRDCCRPPPPISCSVSASSRTIWSRMSAIRLRSGCGSMPCASL